MPATRRTPGGHRSRDVAGAEPDLLLIGRYTIHNAPPATSVAAETPHSSVANKKVLNRSITLGRVKPMIVPAARAVDGRLSSDGQRVGTGSGLLTNQAPSSAPIARVRNGEMVSAAIGRTSAFDVRPDEQDGGAALARPGWADDDESTGSGSAVDVVEIADDVTRLREIRGCRGDAR
jgi:hypothetical protein